MEIFNTIQKDLVTHNGKKCEILRLLDKSERDREGEELMYSVELECGTEIKAFSDELESMDHIVSCIYCFEKINTEMDEFDVSEEGFAICTNHEKTKKEMEIMKIFNSTQSDLLIYNGMRCEVIGELLDSEYDKKDLGLTMYHIELENGKKLQVFEDELTDEKEEIKTEKKVWRIPVTWEVSGEAEVEANSLEEALAIVIDTNDAFLLMPNESFYVDGSFRATSENLDEVRIMTEEE